MSNVLVEKNKLDVLATAISNKSGEPLKLTLDEMVEAVDGIETGGGGITPTGNIDITQAGVTDVTNYATATVPEYIDVDSGYGSNYYTSGSSRRWRVRYSHDGIGGWFEGGVVHMPYYDFGAIPTGTTVTPSTSAQTIGGANYMMEGAVTVNAIPSNYVGSGITRRSSTDLTVSGDTVTAPSGYYSAQASKSVASGSLGNPTTDISKSSLDYDIDISFPSFRQGYISTEPSVEVSLDIEDKVVTPSTSQQVITPTDELCYLNSVTVNAIPSQYIIPSGNLPITANGNNINVSQYATVSVNVSGGGGDSKNAQTVQSTSRSTSTSYTDIISLTCNTTGTYDVYWSTFRSSTSGTWGSQLYLNNTAYGSAQTGSWSNHIQNIQLTGVQINSGTDVAVRVRSRGSNYYGYVGTLTIIQTS